MRIRPFLLVAGLIGSLACICTSASPAGNPSPAVVVAASHGANGEFKALLEMDDRAHTEIEQWIEMAQTNRAGADALGQASLNLKIKLRQDEVARAYDRFLKDHPEHTRARIAYGSFLRDAGRDEEALAQWQQAARLDPGNASVWNNLGNYYGHHGPATNAFQSYQKAIELEPDRPLYYHNLARNIYIQQDVAAAYFKLGEREVVAKAQELYRQALKLAPDDFQIAADLAQSYYSIQLPASGDRKNDLEAARKLSGEALAAWLAALKLARDTEEREGICLHMARIQISAGWYDLARKNLGRVSLPALADTKNELEERLARESSKEAAVRPETVPSPVGK